MNFGLARYSYQRLEFAGACENYSTGYTNFENMLSTYKIRRATYKNIEFKLYYVVA